MVFTKHSVTTMPSVPNEPPAQAAPLMSAMVVLSDRVSTCSGFTGGIYAILKWEMQV